MSVKKQAPPPTIDRRMLAAAGLLLAFSLGLAVGVAVPSAVVLLMVVLLIVAGALAFIAWDTWRKQYQAWVSRPVRVARRVKETAQ